MGLILTDRTPTNEALIIDQVCAIIRKMGYPGLADQFRDEPPEREWIAELTGAAIAKRLGDPAKGARFTDLAMLVA